MSTVSMAAPPPQGAPLSEGERIIDTFIAPSKTFTDLRRKASWIVPWLLISIVSVAFIIVAGQKVGWQRISDNEMASSSMGKMAQAQLDKLPPEQRAEAMHSAAVRTKYSSYGVPIIVLILFAIFALIYMFTFNFGAGAALRFNTAMAVVVYASLPGVIRGLLGIASLYGGMNTESFTFENPIASNASYFMQPGGALYSLAQSFDVFTLWTLVLMGIGFSCVSKVKRGTSIAMVFAWFLLYVLIRVGVAAAFS